MLWTDADLAKPPVDELFNVYLETVKQVDQLRGEYNRRRNGGLVLPSGAALSRLGTDTLMKMITEAAQQQVRAERAMETPIRNTPGCDAENAMVLDDD